MTTRLAAIRVGAGLSTRRSGLAATQDALDAALGFAMQVSGPDAQLAVAGPHRFDALQTLFFYSRAETIYGGSNEIQRNIIGERALGFPSEPKPALAEPRA